MVRTQAIRKFLLAALVTGLSLSLSGCFYLVLGGLGAVGGYAVSPDTVEGTSDRDSEEVWDAAVTVANIMGNITRQSEKEGKLEAIINNSRVNISVMQFTKKKSKILVKARKSFFPNIATAQDVYIKVINQLNE